MAGTHVTSPNQQASLKVKWKKRCKEEHVYISLCVSYFGSTTTTANQQYSQELYSFYRLHSSEFRMHCINDKVDAFVMLGMMVTSTNVIRDVGGRC